MRQCTEIRRRKREKVQALLEQETTGELSSRYSAAVRFSAGIRSSQFYVTNACNIRCEGCWFFKNGMEYAMRDEKYSAIFDERVAAIVRKDRLNLVWILGGEPALRLDRVRSIAHRVRHPIISTNGEYAIPLDGFEHASIFVTVFGGVGIDDQLRAIRPNGKRFDGLFETALRNYRSDPRVTFHLILSIHHPGDIEPTVRRIADNGNRVTFGFYSGADTLGADTDVQESLLDEALRVAAAYPGVVNAHPYFLRTLISGKSHFGTFGHETCASLSRDHAGNSQRLKEGLPTLPFFNAWASDAKTINRCCTSGNCAECRDTEAIFSWLMVSQEYFLDSPDQLRTWVEVVESFYNQFHFSPWLAINTKHRQPESGNEPRPVAVACA